MICIVILKALAYLLYLVLSELLAGTKNGKNFHSNWQKTDLLFFDF